MIALFLLLLVASTNASEHTELDTLVRVRGEPTSLSCVDAFSGVLDVSVSWRPMRPLLAEEVLVFEVFEASNAHVPLFALRGRSGVGMYGASVGPGDYCAQIRLIGGTRQDISIKLSMHLEPTSFLDALLRWGVSIALFVVALMYICW